MERQPRSFEQVLCRALPPPSLIDLRIALIDGGGQRSAYRAPLEVAGALVMTASSVEEAIASSDIRGCDVLIADLELPGTTGDGLARMVHGVGRPRACIGLTRRADGAGLDEAWRAGFRMCVRAPCDPGLLANAAAVLRGSPTKPP